MPSRTEMRCWLLLALALAWGMGLSVVWAWWQEVPGVSPEAVLQHLRLVCQRYPETVLTPSGSTGRVGCAIFFLT